MGADIHWIAERKHSDGLWESAFGKSFCQHLAGDRYTRTTEFFDTPQGQFGERHYRWFGMLSGVRSDPIEPLEEIARPGLPADASQHAHILLGENSGCHSQGYFTVPMLEAALTELTGVSMSTPELRQARKTLQDKINQIRQMLKDESILPVQTANLLYGRSEDEKNGEFYPDMAQESNHSALARTKRIEGYLPVGPDTLRFLIAYDS